LDKFKNKNSTFEALLGLALKNWTIREARNKNLESYKMWRCRRMEKISWTDRVRNGEVLLWAK
jgi:hypothetical protein